MPSAAFAYAFLKAAYAEGIRNPLDAVMPLVKRALMRANTSRVDQVQIQDRIRSNLGIEVPINVIRYTFPSLARQGILRLDDNHVYHLVDAGYADQSVIDLEKVSRSRLDRMYKLLNRVFLDHDYSSMKPQDFLSTWLDESSLAYFGQRNAAFTANSSDRNINRLMYLALTRYPGSPEFLEDLNEIVLGDSLYRAITVITEYDLDETKGPTSARMADVFAYFDTRFVMRALGLGLDPLNRAAAELLNICKATGCEVAVFRHTVEEIQGIIREVARRLTYKSNIKGDVAAYAAEFGLSAGDLIDYASRIEYLIESAGFSIFPKPDLRQGGYDLSIDEVGLEKMLATEIEQGEKARLTDIDSLTGIYRLREGMACRSLERSHAIFVTTNKGLSDTSVKFFQPLFRDEGLRNSVQLCVTDVVFSTLLWAKLPTSLLMVPKEQILAHILTYLQPSTLLRDSFARYLTRYAQENKISEEAAAKIQLSRFVEQCLAAEFDARKSAMNEGEFVSVLTKVIEKQKAVQDAIRKDALSSARQRVDSELDEALNAFWKAKDEVADQDSSIQNLTSQVYQNEREIKALKTTQSYIRSRVNMVSTWAIRIMVAFIVYWLFDSIFSFGKLLESVAIHLKLYNLLSPIRQMDSVIQFIAAAVLTVLTVTGLSIWAAGTAVQSVLTRRIIQGLLPPDRPI